MILGLILTCEIAFWVFLLGGLAVRYLARQPRLGPILLMCAPIVDLVLLVAVGIDLRAGATASWMHGLAALYIGLSVAYGHAIIHWADVRFAHRFAGGPAPVQLFGAAFTRKCWLDLARTLLAGVISAAIIGGLIAWVDDPARTQALSATLRIVGIIVVVDALWAIGYTIWTKRAPTDGQAAVAGTPSSQE